MQLSKTFIDSLPTRLGFTSRGLGYAAALLFERLGAKCDKNISPDSVAWDEYDSGNGVTIQITYEDGIVRASRWSDDASHGEFINGISDLQRRVIKINPIIYGFVVEYLPGGVKVGCTTVPWNVVHELASNDPNNK